MMGIDNLTLQMLTTRRDGPYVAPRTMTQWLYK